MVARLPVELYKEAQAAEKASDLRRAMDLYAKATYFPWATRIALDLGRQEDALNFAKKGGDWYVASQIAIKLGNIDDAVHCLREANDYETANQLAREHGLALRFRVGEIAGESEDILENLAESLYRALTSKKRRNGGFSRLSGNVLDVGCRDGRFFGLLKKLGAGEVYGVDLDSEALKEAKKRKEINPKNVYNSKVEELPSEFNSFFDYALVFNLSLGERDSRAAAVEGIFRVLKPYGRFLATFTELDELENDFPEIERYFSVNYCKLINGSIGSSSAPHRYVMYGFRK